MATVSSIISSASGGAGNLGTLYVKLVADATGVDQGMRDAERSIVGGATSITKAAMLAVAAVTGLATASVVEFAKFEYSFANVRKTVQATEEEFKSFQATFRKMAMDMPTNVNEINNIAAAAGQLGIQKESLASFTKVMVDLGNTTNLKGESAAQQLARLANITRMSQKDFDRLGSTISELDRKSATTAAEILTMSLRIGGAGTTIGMTKPEILGFAAALSSIGIGAEAGGTAITQTMIEMSKAVSTGNKELQAFAQVAGMTGDQFKELFHSNSTEAILRFIEGLKGIEDAGGDAFLVLDKLGLDGARITRTLISAAESGDLFRKLITQGTAAWADNNSLTEMANERYKTLTSQITITWNRLKDLFITVGEALTPSLKEFNKWLQTVLDTNGELAERVRQFAAVAGPAMAVALNYVKQSFQNLAIEIKTFQLLINGVMILIDRLELAARKAANAYVTLHNIAHPIDTLRGRGMAPSTIGVGAEGDIRERQADVEQLKTEIIDLTAASRKSQDEWMSGLPEVTRKFEELFRPIKKVKEELTATDTNLSKDGFFAGLNTTLDTTKAKIDDDTKALRQLQSEMIARSQKIEQGLDKVGAPNPLDFEGRQRGMSKAELNLGAMQGITGMDQGSQQALQIQTEIELNQRKVTELQRLGEMEGALTEETQRRKLQAIEMYNRQAKNLQMAQTAMMMSSFTQIGDSMLTIGSAFFGKQTAMYKAMFAASKAFAIAESTVKIMQGIASAAALPWPANLAAIASVIAATANIVSTIQSVKLEFAGGKALGGPVSPGKTFLVGEKGPEMFVPQNRGTIVPNNRLGTANIRVNINNFTDAKVEVNQREEGDEKVLDVIIRRVGAEMTAQVRDGRGDFNKALTQNFQSTRSRQ